MIIRTHHHVYPFTIIDNRIMDNASLSFKAKGLLCFLLSRPSGWRPLRDHLSSVGPDGRSAVDSGMAELRRAGYVKTIPRKSEDGLFSGKETHVYEEPLPPEEREIDATDDDGNAENPQRTVENQHGNAGNHDGRAGFPANPINSQSENPPLSRNEEDQGSEEEKPLPRSEADAGEVHPEPQPKHSRGKGDARIRQFLDWWCPRYLERFGLKYVPTQGDFGLLKKTLPTLAADGQAVEMLCNAAKPFMADAKVKDFGGYTIRNLCGNPNKWLLAYEEGKLYTKEEQEVYFCGPHGRPVYNGVEETAEESEAKMRELKENARRNGTLPAAAALPPGPPMDAETLASGDAWLDGDPIGGMIDRGGDAEEGKCDAV